MFPSLEKVAASCPIAARVWVRPGLARDASLQLSLRLAFEENSNKIFIIFSLLRRRSVILSTVEKGEAIAIPWLFASRCYVHQVTRCPTPSAGNLIQGTRRRNNGDPACKEGGMEEGQSGKRNTIAAAGNLSRPAPPPELRSVCKQDRAAAFAEFRASHIHTANQAEEA